MERAKSPVQQCAVYTRKSSEEGLEQDFNSLQAQREACEAFIKSQAGEGWRLVKTAYDDGGISGGTMERPALQHLLSDIDEGRIDVVVVYKVDRLTRSLTDFAKMVEIFDAHHVSFVSITQQFNTTTSMGRLTLNVLLSFAQFEREVTGERIRDKIAASKKKGMWMGGFCSLGYDVRDRRLVVNQVESKLVGNIYKRYLELGSVRLLKHDLDRRGIVSKIRVSKSGSSSGGRSFSRGALYELLANPIYIGEIRHKKVRHPGQHEAIVDRQTWEKVQRRLRDQTARDGTPQIKAAGNVLTGRLFDEKGKPLYSTGAKGRHGGRYRYYVSRELVRGGRSSVGKEKSWRLAAPELEQSVVVSVCRILNDHAAIATTLQEAGVSSTEIDSVLKATEAKSVWLESGPQAASTVAELVKRVDLRKNGIEISMNLEPLLPPESMVRRAPLLTFSRFVPLQMKRRGVAMRLVIGGGVSTRKTDPTLLKAVARAHKWFNELASGRAAFTREIAAREGVNERFVRRLIPLAFLSPTIVQAIAYGRHPADLTGEALSRGINIPVEWDKQRVALAFE
ncbi:MAG: recombinase family protein [Candidatus Binatus sp.]|uniref:recombinase family protein n=1 Tax=Candidatus Binatus sp. TaxID=2811406 RepID=UPI00271E2A9A|nr:recombinase family protein [Candidatus Binatus sp.]MDO8431087.1 recombinase family protein [Candidatus Binatus sp.]